MEMNVEKTKVMTFSRKPLPVKIMIDQKQLENVESFKYLGSILTNDGRYNCYKQIKMGALSYVVNIHPVCNIQL
jgi:hypothetical protein